LTPSRYRGEAEYPAGQLIYRGAEADIIRGTWQGLDAVYKVRKPLAYRLPVLDEAIRHHRTVREAEMMHSAKQAGVTSPRVYYVDPPAATLVMEYAEGKRVKDMVDRLPADEVAEIFSSLGRYAAKLHSSGVVHGDLTTANLVRRNGDLVFLDFGLSSHSSKAEDHAVDLRLIKETVMGAHSSVAPVALESLLDGYSAEAGETRSMAVLGQLRSIERRGRYARLG
jgi:TP53 regulating kinase-like protein